MSAALTDKERHVVPRWRDSNVAGALGELDPSAERSRVFDGTEESWREKRDAWATTRQLSFAADLLGAALTLGKFEEADEAARYVSGRKSDASPALQLVAERLLHERIGSNDPQQPKFERQSLSAAVHLTRERLRNDPRNAIAWTDLARAYASLGFGVKAERAIRLATGISRANRFVLRSAARLHLHLGDTESAHRLLRDNELVKSDPWVVAAEIVAADLDGRTSRLVRRGREFLASRNFGPFHLGELACAIGSLELKSGRIKAAKKLFQSALIKPTENSLAQIEWASQRLQDFTLFPWQFEIPFSHEARARYSFAAGDWRRAVDESIDWFADEPFASQSSTLGSYVAAEHLEDFVLSADIASQGLIASPEDPSLLNNFAFALASQGKLGEATKAINRLDLRLAALSTQICYHATVGLIAFRLGDTEKGRASYNDAISLAKGPALAKLRAHAAVNLAQEELRIDSPDARSAVVSAIEHSRLVADDDFRGVLKRLQKIVVSKIDLLGDIDRIVEDVVRLMTTDKDPLPTTQATNPDRVPLM